jgi:predicted lactoylglutathione lyase
MYELEPVVVTDFNKANEFWRGVLGTVGYAPQHNFANLQTFGKWAHCPNFSIVQANTGRPMKRVIQLQVDDSEEVVEFYKKAVATGGKEVEVPELVDGERFVGKFLDLDENTVEVYCEQSTNL